MICVKKHVCLLPGTDSWGQDPASEQCCEVLPQDHRGTARGGAPCTIRRVGEILRREAGSMGGSAGGRKCPFCGSNVQTET